MYNDIAAFIRAPREAGDSMPSVANTVEERKSKTVKPHEYMTTVDINQFVIYQKNYTE